MTASSSIFSYETLVHAISGSCGSVVAMLVALPLDTVRTRMLLDEERSEKNALKVLKTLINDEGFFTLYRAMSSTLQCVAASNFVYFYTFHGLKKLVGSTANQSAVKDLLFACIAGSCNVLLTNPLWVVNSRLKMQGTDKSNSKRRYKSLLDGYLKIGFHEGISSLWSGTIPSLVLVSNPAIKFTAYEFIKRKLLESGIPLEGGRAFFVGAVATAIATIVTYPVQVVQTKARHGHSYQGLDKTAGMVGLFRYIIRNFGVNYLYRGLEAKLLQSVITAGFMFLTYEQIAAFIFMAFGIRKNKLA